MMIRKADAFMIGRVHSIETFGAVDGPGVRFVVFFQGCPMRCAYCHNPDTWDVNGGTEMSVDEIYKKFERNKAFYERGGVTASGGEPMLQFDFLKELCEAARAAGVHVALDTSGYAPWERFAELAPFVDLFLYDLKCMDPARHVELTGVPNDLILENLRRLDATGAKFWIRCPLVPGLNDSDSDLAALRKFTSALRNMEKLEICPYHPLGLEKCATFGLTPCYAEKALPTSADLARWRQSLCC